MSDDRRRVLDMLSEGKIGVDDAERLLETLNVGSDDEGRAQDKVEGRLQFLDHPLESLSSEIENAVRKTVTVVLDEVDEASTNDDTFQVGDCPRLEVRSFNGPVRVSAGEPGTIRVRASLRDPRMVEYSAVQEGDTIKVEANPKRRSSGFLSGLFDRQSGAEIDVTVPTMTTVNVVTSNGPMEIRGTSGGGTLETSNSRIQVQEFKGDLTAQTSNGRIAIESLEGSAKLTTSNGRVSIKNGHGQFDVTTSNGRIEFQGSLSPDGRNRLTTYNGRIDVVLDDEPNLRLEASTVNARVQCELTDFLASVDTRHRLEGTVGDGEAELIAKTVNGSITIR